MSRTYVPEEDTRVADLTELQNLYPTSNRVVFVKSKDNFYWWETGGDASQGNGDNLVESNVPGFQDGDTNEGLWHLSASNIASNTTDDLTEGSTNLYFTEQRARNALSASGDLNYDPNTGEFSVQSVVNTDELTEGSTNLFFTEQRVRNALSASGDLFYNSNTGEFSVTTVKSTDQVPEGSTNLYFTDERAQDAVGSILGEGFVYDDAGNQISKKISLAAKSIGQTSSNLTLDASEDRLFEFEPTSDIEVDVIGLPSNRKTRTYLAIKNGGEQNITFKSAGQEANWNWIDGNPPSLSNQQTVGSTFDLSGYSATGNTGPLSSEYARNALSLRWGPNGDTLFAPLVDEFGDSTPDGQYIELFDASSPYDITNLSTSGDRINITGQTGELGQGPTPITDVAFNGDGTKVYVSGSAQGQIVSYSLSSAYGSNGSFVASVDTTSSPPGGSSHTIDPKGLEFNDTGTTLIVSGTDSGTGVLNAYALTSPYDITTIFASVQVDVSADEADPLTPRFNDDGTKLFVAGEGSSGPVPADVAPTVSSWALSKPYDITTLSFENSLNTGTDEVTGIDFSPSGDRLHVLDITGSPNFENETIKEFGASQTTVDGLDIISVHQVGEETYAEVEGLNTKTTDELPEGSTNLYFTEERVDDRVNNLIVPGLNLTSTYNDNTDSLILDVDNNLSSYNVDITTDDIAEGSSNHYFTEQRARNSVSASGGLNYNSNTGVFSVDSLDLSQKTTDELSEGSSNLYFTEQRAREAVSASGDINLKTEVVNNAYDLTTASFSGKSFGVGSETDFPQGVTFNGDGTKMFVVARNDENIYVYDLTTGFDVSTASFSGTSFDVSSEDGSPQGIHFNSDGTKMFIVGRSNANVYEYDLTTGFDVSTASYSGTSFDVLSEDNDPQGVTFNGDGTKMFVIGRQNEGLYEYNLTTGFDLSTASFSGTSFDVTSEDPGGRGVQFNGDGTRMFMVGGGNQSIFEYGLTTGFDLSTASFLGSSLDVSSEPGTPTGVQFNGDGSKMFTVTVGVADSVYEYDVGTTSQTAEFNLDISELSATDLFGNKTTDDLPEGSNNLYFSDERVDDRVNTILKAGNAISLNYDDQNDTLTISGQQVTAENIQDDAWDVLTGSQTLINVTYDDANDEVDFVVESNLSQYTNDAGFITDLSLFTTDDLMEGSTNLYFTDERVDDRVNSLLQAGNAISLTYDDATDTLTIAGQQVSAGNIQDDAWNVLTGTQSLIDVTYDGPNDEVDFVVESNLSQYTNDAGFITDLSSFTTDNLTEGSSNLYYTDARVDNELNKVRPVGQDTFSGDGNTKTFDISHGLGVVPDAWLVSAGTDDASGISHTTATDTTLTVHYDSAPPSGTGNVVINWFVDSVGTNFAPLWQNQGDVTYEK